MCDRLSSSWPGRNWKTTAEHSWPYYRCIGVDIEPVDVAEPCSAMHICYPYKYPISWPRRSPTLTSTSRN